jgi:hypothetical protein
VEAAPADTALRLHLADLLIEAGERDEARRHLGQVLTLDPASERALTLLAATREPEPSPKTTPRGEDDPAIDWTSSTAASRT